MRKIRQGEGVGFRKLEWRLAHSISLSLGVVHGPAEVVKRYSRCLLSLGRFRLERFQGRWRASYRTSRQTIRDAVGHPRLYLLYTTSTYTPSIPLRLPLPRTGSSRPGGPLAPPAFTFPRLYCPPMEYHPLNEKSRSFAAGACAYS